MIITNSGMFAWLDSKIFKSLRDENIAYVNCIYKNTTVRHVTWMEKIILKDNDE